MLLDIHKRFFLKEDNTEDVICFSLDCWEQYLYFSIKDYEIDSKIVFCNDINVYYDRDKKEINRNTIDFNKNLFSIKTCVDNKNFVKIIEEIISRNNIAVLKTVFNLLEPYTWSNYIKHMLYTTHNMGIIGLDDIYYYFIDSPMVINKEWPSISKENPCIFKIERYKLERVCSIYCKVSEIKVNVSYIHKIAKLKDIIQQIVVNYYDVGESNNRLLGGSALNEIKKDLYSGVDINQLAFFKDHFLCHLIYSRIFLLKICIEEDNTYRNKTNFCTIINLLNSLLGAWYIIKEMILKNSYVKINDFIHRIIKKMDEIHLLENKLVSNLEVF